MSKILYAAGSMNHINSFHLPYIEKLRADGHEVFTMASGKGADFDIKFVKKMVSFGNIKCQRKIKKILEEENFDVLILNTTLAAFNIRFCLPKKNRPKVINFVHGYMFPTEIKGLRNKIFFFCEKLLRKKTDHILVMNDDDYKMAVENKLCVGEVVMTRGMGASVPNTTNVPRELIYKLHESEDKYIICFVGELYKSKNQRMLICALPEIQIKIPNAVLWFVGDGIDRQMLVDLAETLNLSNSVYFMGRRKNPFDYIRASDLYVSASEKEGLPFNILEALGCEKTVICSDIKGHRDIIKNGESGYLYENGNMNDLIRLVIEAHDGKIAIEPEKAYAQYEEYSFDKVFSDTYGKMADLINK